MTLLGWGWCISSYVASLRMFPLCNGHQFLKTRMKKLGREREIKKREKKMTTFLNNCDLGNVKSILYKTF